MTRLLFACQDHEPGWLGGELGGKVGWFPEAFAERVVEGGEHLQPIAEVLKYNVSPVNLPPGARKRQRLQLLPGYHGHRRASKASGPC